MTVTEAARLMRARQVKRLPVTNQGGHLIGIVSRIDLLSAYGRDDYEIRDEIIGDVVARDFCLDPEPPEVLVRTGIVTITGQVESRAVGRQLLAAVRHVEGSWASRVHAQRLSERLKVNGRGQTLIKPRAVSPLPLRLRGHPACP